jgi:hypothetical protein
VTFNSTELGSTATGAAAATSSSVLFGFTSAAAPASFAILEAGATKPDFVIGTGGTCVAGAAQAANSSCTVNVTLSPNSAGSVAGKLAALDGSGNVLASIVLHGTGLGSAAQILPGTEGALGTGLKTPSQVAVDAGGNTYVADPGLGTVELFAKGAGAAAGTSVGTGLTAPTGVATDGAGDVFIADSGNIIEVPRGSAGLNAAGQATVRTGLGTGLNLAADGSGNVYVADPINHRVVKLGSVGGTFDLLSQTETDYGGFNAPSAVAVDENEDLFVADGTNLYEIAPTGAQTTVLTSLTNATGLAVDPSGAVYVTEGGQTTRIPNVAGTRLRCSGRDGRHDGSFDCHRFDGRPLHRQHRGWVRGDDQRRRLLQLWNAGDDKRNRVADVHAAKLRQLSSHLHGLHGNGGLHRDFHQLHQPGRRGRQLLGNGHLQPWSGRSGHPHR